MGRKYAFTAYPHVSITNLFIFVVHYNVYYTMMTVTFADAQSFTTPSTLTDKYVDPGGDTIILLDAMEVSAMCDGTRAGYIRQMHGYCNEYEVKNSTVSCASRDDTL